MYQNNISLSMLFQDGRPMLTRRCVTHLYTACTALVSIALLATLPWIKSFSRFARQPRQRYFTFVTWPPDCDGQSRDRPQQPAARRTFRGTGGIPRALH